MSPHSIRLNLLYAQTLLLKNQPAMALSVLTSIQDEAENTPEYLDLMASTQQALGHNDQAIALYRFLLLQDANNPRLLLNLATLLEKEKKNPEALEIYQTLATQPDLPPTFKAYIRQRLDKIEH